jgi:hypothetical protein
MGFAPGQSGNPAGRKALKRKIVRTLLAGDFKDSDSVDGIALVATIAALDRAPLQMRLQAAMFLATYQKLKPNERVGCDLQLPEATSVEVATANLAKIAHFASSDRITPSVARDLADLQQRFIDAKIGNDTEARLEALEQALARFRPAIPIVVESSLGPLPGTSIAMPEVLAVPDGGHRDREPEP